MIKILFFLSTAIASDPQMEITVHGKKHNEVYMQETHIVCKNGCTFNNSTEAIFVAANQHHNLWLRNGKISAIYNENTVGFTYPECDFKKETMKCVNENNLWLLKSSITLDEERATLSLTLLDSTGVLIGQASYVRHKKTKVIEHTTIVRQEDPHGMKPTVEVTQIDPEIIDIPPMIFDKDIHQAMIMLYDSVRKRN